jgi:hypothetical protein
MSAAYIRRLSEFAYGKTEQDRINSLKSGKGCMARRREAGLRMQLIHQRDLKLLAQAKLEKAMDVLRLYTCDNYSCDECKGVDQDYPFCGFHASAAMEDIEGMEEITLEDKTKLRVKDEANFNSDLREMLTAANSDAKEAEAYAEELEGNLAKAVECLKSYAETSIGVWAKDVLSKLEKTE